MGDERTLCLAFCILSDKLSQCFLVELVFIESVNVRQSRYNKAATSSVLQPHYKKVN